ncbi:MAG: hypothetical protein AB7F86_05835 [Bdellovibrionales bacterium]
MKAYFLAFAPLVLGLQAHAACPAGTTARGDMVENRPVCTVQGQYLSTNLTLTADNAYVLEGDIRIGSDNADASTLTIEPDTHIYGTAGAVIVVMRGSKIFVNGTETKPVIMTSLQRNSLRPGLWGGLVLNGNAPINACAAGTPVCEAESEGFADNKPKFGGNQPAESSGHLHYLRIEYPGYEIAPDNEINGLTLNGVGAGTDIDHVQVLKSADDGIEIFGGTVGLKHIVITDADDDGLDWDFGWQGKAQFATILVESGTEKVNGIEASSFKDNHSAQPRSNPTISNLTIVGKGQNSHVLNGIVMNTGTGAQFYNTIVTGSYTTACIQMDDAETFNNGGSVTTAPAVEQAGIKFVNTIVFCDKGNNFDDKASDPYLISELFRGSDKSQSLVVSPMLTGFRPAESSPAVGKWIAPPTAGFVEVDYAGAMSPFADEDWTAGWTVQ